MVVPTIFGAATFRGYTFRFRDVEVVKFLFTVLLLYLEGFLVFRLFYWFINVIVKSCTKNNVTI